MSDQWGVGDQANAKAFDVIKEGELIFGQFPHSRQDNNIYLRRKDGSIEDFDGHRRLIDVSIKSENYLKESGLSGDEVRKSVVGTITVDGVALVEIYGREVQQVMKWIDRAIDEYGEHSSGWFNKESRAKLIGRKIWYHEQPATIVGLVEDQGCIMIALEPGATPPPSRHSDDDEEDAWDDWKRGDHYEVKDDVLSPHIWWWRD